MLCPNIKNLSYNPDPSFLNTVLQTYEYLEPYFNTIPLHEVVLPWIVHLSSWNMSMALLLPLPLFFLLSVPNYSSCSGYHY